MQGSECEFSHDSQAPFNDILYLLTQVALVIVIVVRMLLLHLLHQGNTKKLFSIMFRENAQVNPEAQTVILNLKMNVP